MENENMNNGTQVGENNNGTNSQQVQQPVAQQPAPMQPQPVVIPEQKENWFKKNWKKLLAGTAAVGGVVGSAFVAYNKGKQAGADNVCYPPNDDEDYSLNPNV